MTPAYGCMLLNPNRSLCQGRLTFWAGPSDRRGKRITSGRRWRHWRRWDQLDRREARGGRPEPKITRQGVGEWMYPKSEELPWSPWLERPRRSRPPQGG